VTEALLKVGELAARTGLTVRTLHHYDEIGLLRPSRRTAAGHRLYGLAEVRRLQQVASLRQMGLSLEDIQACLDRPGYSLEHVLALQIGRLREEMDRQARLVDMLESLLLRLEAGESLSVDDVTEATEATIHFERYYTTEQLARLESRAKALGPSALADAQHDWASLFSALADGLRSGLEPSDARVLAVARRGRELIEAFTGGDPGIRASLEHMYRDGAGDQAMRNRGMGVEPEVMAYYRAAMAALARTEG
jgi:DNA-binding transcriptional MerR regulator